MYQTRENISEVKNESVYVVADFDRTLTKGSSNTTWGILGSSKLLPSDYAIKGEMLFEKYRPIELDVSLPFPYRLTQISNWFNEHIDLLVKCKLKEEVINELIENECELEFREGIEPFLKYLYENQIPLIIISAGVGNFIKAFLKKNNCDYDNIYICSNMLKFENGIMTGIENDVIHSLNKNSIFLPIKIKEKLINRFQIILLGDQVDDIKMVSEDKRKDTIRIGFTTDESQKKVYEQYFDFVCDNSTTYQEIGKRLFKEYKYE